MTPTPTRPTIDVAQLPPKAFDAHAPAWWGNLLMLFIESMTVTMLLAAYFYLWRNQSPWPPPRGDREPAILDPVPDLGAATANAALLIASCGLMARASRAAREGREAIVLGSLLVLTLIGAIGTALHFYEFPALKFRWDDNAYASVVWAAVFLHIVYLVVGAIEVGLLSVWVATHGLDERHALDVTVTAVYWYWMAGAWLLLYAVVWWWPRVA
jgi:heme/copper-type cytochrome/quinol oxidase subunit 3